MSPTSPLTLPWTTLRLAGRFAVPLALWFTVGQALRYVLFLGGYTFGLHNPVVPIVVISLTVMVTLVITVMMMHSVRDGLRAVRERDLDESLTSWVAHDEETILNAVTRALLPFMIFYLAWGWFVDDAKAYEQTIAGRANAEGGLMAQIAAMKSVVALDDHLYIAIALTAGFLVAKFVTERVVEPRWSRIGSGLLALFEVNWTLFGLFSVNKGLDAVKDWLHSRVAWGWLADVSGPLFGWTGTFWPLFKSAVLGAVVWLVIAGVILGVDAREETALGQGRMARRVATVSGMDRPRRPREVLTREFRDKWLPTVYGLRMVYRAGVLSFAVFCVLFIGLDVVIDLLKRGVFEFLGPHKIGWWVPRGTIVDFAVGLVHQALRVCLMAAAFDVVVARVSGRSAEPRSSAPVPAPPTFATPPAPQS